MLTFGIHPVLLTDVLMQLSHQTVDLHMLSSWVYTAQVAHQVVHECCDVIRVL